MAYYREYDKIYTKEAEGIHYFNFVLVVISWIFTITMILLPRFAWFNPDVRSSSETGGAPGVRPAPGPLS